MRKNHSFFGKARTLFSVAALSVILLAFTGYASAYTVSGVVTSGGAPVTTAIVHLMDGNNDVGNAHVDQNGYFVIVTACANECKLIAVPDDAEANYVPTYYPNQPDGHRGYVIYPADNPENSEIEPIVFGDATIAGGSLVTVTGNINVVNISGVPAFVYVMNGGTILSYHRVNADGTFSFTENMNSGSSIMIANAGFNTVYMNYDQATNVIVTRENTATWTVNINMDAISGNGSVVTPSNGMTKIHSELKLNQNYPNPFNPTTNISYNVPNAGLVKVLVYDLSGRMVSQLVNEYKNAGSYSVTFNAATLSSGIYFYSIENGNTRITKQMMLIK